MNEQGQSQRRVATSTYAEIRACGKVRFPSKKNARARARVIGGTMSAYKCRLCRRWHVGHARYLIVA